MTDTPYKMNKNLTFHMVYPPRLYPDSVTGNNCTYVVGEVCWKGEKFLHIAASVTDPKIDRRLNNKTPAEYRDEYVKGYHLRSEWKLYKFYHGEFASYSLAADKAHAVANEMEAFIREKFFKPSVKTT